MVTELKEQIYILSTRAIVHPCLDVIVIKDVESVSRGICNNKQALHTLQIQPIFITSLYNSYILYEILHHDHIKYKRQIK